MGAKGSAGAAAATVGRPKGVTVGRVPGGNFTFSGSAGSPKGAAANAKRKGGPVASGTSVAKTKVGRNKKSK